MEEQQDRNWSMRWVILWARKMVGCYSLRALMGTISELSLMAIAAWQQSIVATNDREALIPQRHQFFKLPNVLGLRRRHCRRRLDFRFAYGRPPRLCQASRRSKQRRRPFIFEYAPPDGTKTA